MEAGCKKAYDSYAGPTAARHVMNVTISLFRFKAGTAAAAALYTDCRSRYFYYYD